MSRDPQREWMRVREAVRSLSANANAWRIFVTHLAQLCLLYTSRCV